MATVPQSEHTTAPGRQLVFAHANGFPAGTYRMLFDIWRAAGWQVSAPERLGHDPQYPAGPNWEHLADELIAHVDSLAVGPVAVVGHSLGGLLGLMLACLRPDLASAVVILDAPVITGWRAQGLKLLKHTRLIERLSPGRVSRRRRTEWADRGSARAHFAAKPVFARWHPQVLDDYIACGFDDDDGRLLRGFDRAIETRIYNTLPHHLGRLLRAHPLRCPLAVIAGTRSLEMRLGIAETRALAGDRFVRIAGGHLYPMERPQETAQRVLDLLDGESAPSKQARTEVG
jgi:pimeloyl-ACP methyl ester carboxylesterase